MSTSIIYKITNIRSNKSYIGQFRREDESAFQSYWGSGDVIKKAIKKHGKHNFKKEIIVQGNFNKHLTNDLEIHYIRLYNTVCPYGYNITNGGNYTTPNPATKQIHQFDLEGEFIKTWNKTREAQQVLGISNLAAVVKGRQKTSGGFIWTRDKRNITTKIKKASGVIKTQHNIFWVFNKSWKKWKSVDKASDFYDISKTQLHRILNNKRQIHWIKNCFISRTKLRSVPDKKSHFELKFKPITRYCIEDNIIKIFNTKREILNEGYTWSEILKCVTDVTRQHKNYFWYIGDMPEKVKEYIKTVYVSYNDNWYEFKTASQVTAFMKCGSIYIVNKLLKDKGGWYKGCFITTDKNNFIKKPSILEIDINSNTVVNTYSEMIEICKKYSIPSSTLSRWVKNKRCFNNLLFKIEIV